jgi:hypothetical protein
MCSEFLEVATGAGTANFGLSGSGFRVNPGMTAVCAKITRPRELYSLLRFLDNKKVKLHKYFC